MKEESKEDGEDQREYYGRDGGQAITRQVDFSWPIGQIELVARVAEPIDGDFDEHQWVGQRWNVELPLHPEAVVPITDEHGDHTVGEVDHSRSAEREDHTQRDGRHERTGSDVGEHRCQLPGVPRVQQREHHDHHCDSDQDLLALDELAQGLVHSDSPIATDRWTPRNIARRRRNHIRWVPAEPAPTQRIDQTKLVLNYCFGQPAISAIGLSALPL